MAVNSIKFSNPFMTCSNGYKSNVAGKPDDKDLDLDLDLDLDRDLDLDLDMDLDRDLDKGYFCAIA